MFLFHASYHSKFIKYLIGHFIVKNQDTGQKQPFCNSAIADQRSNANHILSLSEYIYGTDLFCPSHPPFEWLKTIFLS